MKQSGLFLNLTLGAMLLVVVVPSTFSAQPTSAGHSPLVLDGDTAWLGEGEAFIAFGKDQQTSFRVSTEHAVAQTAYHRIEATWDVGPLFNGSVPHEYNGEAQQLGAFEAILRKSSEHASVVVLLDDPDSTASVVGVGLAHQGLSKIYSLRGGADPHHYLGEDSFDLFRKSSSFLEQRGVAWGVLDGETVLGGDFSGWGPVLGIEFHGFAVECLSGDCPEGAPSSSTRASKSDTFVRLVGPMGLGSVEANGGVLYAASTLVHASVLEIALDGVLRIPPGGCDRDPCSKDATITVQGNDMLLAMAKNDDGSLSLGVSGIEAADRDNTPWIRPRVAGAAAFGLLSVFIIIKSFIWSLLQVKELQQEKRNKLYIFIKENPGATFREVVKNTQIATGTARHHLGVLRRTGLIQTHQHHATLRFFENHDRFNRTWNTVVLLREPALADLHAWLMKHPGAIQKEILAHTESAWDWGRSTTQHRLSRLHEEGLVNIKLQGRRKVYTAVEVAPLPEERAALASPAVHLSAGQA